MTGNPKKVMNFGRQVMPHDIVTALSPNCLQLYLVTPLFHSITNDIIRWKDKNNFPLFKFTI